MGIWKGSSGIPEFSFILEKFVYNGPKLLLIIVMANRLLIIDHVLPVYRSQDSPVVAVVPVIFKDDA